MIEAKRPHKPGRRAGLRACVSRPVLCRLQKFRIVVAMKIYPGALRGLCSTLKDKVNAVHQDVEAMGTARYITLRREPQARNR